MIVAKNISKTFGPKKVLKNISLVIEGGQIFCVLGRNGAGKSTLLNILCNIIQADAGEIQFGQLSFTNQSRAIYLQMGIQSQFNTLIEELSGYDYLKFVGKIFGLKPADTEIQIESLTNYFSLHKSDLNTCIKNYSTGMKKKTALCAAFINKPKYLILDEPFANIDPIFADALCALLKSYSREDRMIIIASHDLLYLDKIATHVGVIEEGSLVHCNDIEAFKSGLSIDNAFLNIVKNDLQDSSTMVKQIVS